MEKVSSHFDVAVVGAGIVGLALAYESARQGRRVVVFERHPQAVGATVRNFGMIWPIGQAAATFERAMITRSVWLELAEKARFWAPSWGSLHLAYHADEWAVLEEFVDTRKSVGYDCRLLTPAEVPALSPVVKTEGLQGALYSSTEVNVDPRQATQQLHRYLREALGVTILYNTAITRVEYPILSNGVNFWRAEQIYICSGADFETLYPAEYAASGLTKCKLQMLRSKPQPKDWKLGPNLAAGLTLQHYASFSHCNSLHALKNRFAEEMPLYNQWGIHVLLSQTSLGELTIGDSHEYGLHLSPFDRQEINDLILDYLKTFVQLPSLRIAETWNGIYAKLPGETAFVSHPEPNVTIVNGLSGAGMTLSFGLARELID